MHIRFVSSIDKDDTDDSHTGQDQARRYEEDSVDSSTEIITLKVPVLFAPYEDLHHQQEYQE
jgi:hypothetical protein